MDINKWWRGELICKHCGHIKCGIVPKPPWNKKKNICGVECARCHQRTCFPKDFKMSREKIKNLLYYSDLQ